MLINGRPVRFHVDCGATVNVLPVEYVDEDNWLNQQTELYKCGTKPKCDLKGCVAWHYEIPRTRRNTRWNSWLLKRIQHHYRNQSDTAHGTFWSAQGKLRASSASESHRKHQANKTEDRWPVDRGVQGCVWRRCRQARRRTAPGSRPNGTTHSMPIQACTICSKAIVKSWATKTDRPQCTRACWWANWLGKQHGCRNQTIRRPVLVLNNWTKHSSERDTPYRSLKMCFLTWARLESSQRWMNAMAIDK